MIPTPRANEPRHDTVRDRGRPLRDRDAPPVIEGRMPPDVAEGPWRHVCARRPLHASSGTPTTRRTEDDSSPVAGLATEMPAETLYSVRSEGAFGGRRLVMAAPTTAGDRREFAGPDA
jgi:hypothetical protein